MTFFRSDPDADRIGNALVEFATTAFAGSGLRAESLGMTLLLHEAPLGAASTGRRPAGYAHQGDRPFYPCSVVKVFYLAAAQARLEEGFITEHDDLIRAMRDMILVSSNMATNYVIDLVTGTTGDTLLAPDEMARWSERRQWVNRYLRSLGWPELAPINVCQKLMDDDRYGREKAFVGADGANHNRLTTNAAARLFHEILTGGLISPERSRIMADLLRRPTDAAFVAQQPAAQILTYFGEGLPPGTRLWSKAGLTGWTGDPAASYRRHDAAYFELPSGRCASLVVFTEGRDVATNPAMLPAIARRAVELIDGQ